jgi:hypothetical protein
MIQGLWIKSLNVVLTDMIAAGGVHCLPARTPRPMHCALRLLYEDAGRTGGHDRDTEALRSLHHRLGCAIGSCFVDPAVSKVTRRAQLRWPDGWGSATRTRRWITVRGNGRTRTPT